jgi:membrane protease YdiL (CAAX protease family)
MRKESSYLIWLAAGLVLAGLIVVWIGLQWSQFEHLGNWSRLVAFSLGGGSCLAGSILGMTLVVKRYLAEHSQPAARPRKRHQGAAQPVVTGRDALAIPGEGIDGGGSTYGFLSFGLSAYQAVWVAVLAILIPVLLLLGIGWIPVTRVGTTLAGFWLGFQVNTWLPALVKNWPVTGTLLQAIFLIISGALFLTSRKTTGKQDDHAPDPLSQPGASPRNLSGVFRKSLSPWTICFSLLAGAGLWLVAVFVQRVTLAVAPTPWQDWFNILTVGGIHAYGKTPGMPYHWFILAVVIVLVPLVEEIFFRGFLYHAWSSRNSQTWGWVGSSALWAIYSLNPLLMPSFFVVGLGLGMIAHQMVYSTGRIQSFGQFALRFFPLWLVHMVFVGLVFLA